ncbi:MAG: hypothetical protein IJB41_03360 [Clostridia bacterium]|nr:hypothetical protein [Clostridia bacterium]
MKLPDRLVLIVAVYFASYFTFCRSGCIAYVSAILSALCSACIYCAIHAVWDRTAKRRKRKSSVRAAAKRLLLALSYMPEQEAREYLRKWIGLELIIREEKECGLIGEKDGRKMFIACLFRHPESGPVRVDERQQVRKRASLCDIEEACLISLCAKGEPCADPDLDTIRMIDGADLVSLFVRHEDLIPPRFFEEEGHNARKKLFRFLCKPPADGKVLHSLGYAAMLLPGWLFSRNPLFLLAIVYQLYICLFKLFSRKKQAHAQLFR